MFITPEEVRLHTVNLLRKNQNEYSRLQKTRNNQFPKEINLENGVFRYDFTLSYTPGKCRVSDEVFKFWIRGTPEQLGTITKGILKIFGTLLLVQPKFEQVSFYHTNINLEEKLHPKKFLQSKLTFPILNQITGNLILYAVGENISLPECSIMSEKNQKKENPSKNTDSEQNLRKKSKEENSERISANAKLVEEMGKMKVSSIIISSIIYRYKFFDLNLIYSVYYLLA